MTRYWMSAALAVSLSANVAVAVMALRARSMAGTPGEPPLFSRIALDPDQKGRIAAMRERLLVDRAAQARRLADLRVAVARRLVQDPQDPRALEETLAEMEGAQAAFQRRVIAHVRDVMAVLRPEQRPAFGRLVTSQLRGGMPFDASRPVTDDGGGR